MTPETIRAALEQHYQLTVTALERLALGKDAFAQVYRAATIDGTAYFVKLRAGAPREAALALPWHLSQQGMTAVIPPLATADGRLWATLDGHTLIVYPYIVGRGGMRGGLSPAQWVAYGATVRQLHATSLPADLRAALPRETFTPGWVDLLADLHRLSARQADELAALWHANRALIDRLARRALDLSSALRGRTFAPVLCHGDIHVNNLLLTADDRLYMVDWDEALLAPVERDLMFIVGGMIGGFIVRPEDEALFFEGYGAAQPDPVALAYYRYDWAVQDITAYARRIWLDPAAEPAEQADALRILRNVLEPADIVAAALRSEPTLPPHLRGT